ncbi:aldo/keto reductase [Nocardiopsis algeriensis]|uniref:Aryl-alcohol dehydrogenase-like predicted oxidoreductase n=1 Tax=Nocardiopsis algeriensis TaxID=1478215 RepID=A0A841IRF1_9ACTN|nr:aldo/keto reductase [Nocardiopsis algeriensis]MBB6121253.1 aryl-alcohol dehydrogenase-like predicted oxidoreductase [Nocardiopsis algeriensis]
MRRTTVGDRTVSALCLGAMKFGSETDDATSAALLDRFVEAGGTFVDTANCYQFWVEGFEGHESETFLGRWRRERGITDEVVIATKLGARPTVPGTGLETKEGLSATAVAEAAERSRERLGVERLDVLYAHHEDARTPIEETVGAFADLVAEGAVALTGLSNHRTWRIERARAAAEAGGLPRPRVLQYRHSYLQPRLDMPLQSSGHMHVTPELLDFVRAEAAAGRDHTLVAYTPLLWGAYTRPDKALDPAYDHPGTARRLAVLDEVAQETGATRNQVVLAWLMDSDPPVVPLVGVSSIAQLDEAIEATDLSLSPEQWQRLADAR